MLPLTSLAADKFRDTGSVSIFNNSSSNIYVDYELCDNSKVLFRSRPIIPGETYVWQVKDGFPLGEDKAVNCLKFQVLDVNQGNFNFTMDKVPFVPEGPQILKLEYPHHFNPGFGS